MKEIAKTAINEIVGRLVREFDPEKIILFGSHVWGTPHADSDVDIFIIVSHADIPPVQRATRAYRCLQGLGIPTEVIVSTSQEVERFRSVPSSLTRKILERGKIVYE